MIKWINWVLCFCELLCVYCRSLFIDKLTTKWEPFRRFVRVQQTFCQYEWRNMCSLWELYRSWTLSKFGQKVVISVCLMHSFTSIIWRNRDACTKCFNLMLCTWNFYSGQVCNNHLSKDLTTTKLFICKTMLNTIKILPVCKQHPRMMQLTSSIGSKPAYVYVKRMGCVIFRAPHLGWLWLSFFVVIILDI